jgi:hypothetical protein
MALRRAHKLDEPEPKSEPKSEPNPQDSLSSENQILKAQLTLLQEQLKQKSDAEEQKRLEMEADRLRQDEEALREEADLQKLLGTAFPTAPAQSSYDGEPQALDQKQMISIMGEAVGKAMDANTKLIETKMAKILNDRDNKIDETQKALIGLMANMSVNEARSVHKDFDEYKTEVRDILGRVTGLSPEEAFLLAKAQKQSSQPEPNVMSSERPHNAVVRSETHGSSPREQYEEPTRPVSSRRRFQDACSAAIDKVIAARAR